MSKLHRLTIAEGSALLQRRELSPVEWTRALLDRIATFDGQLHAFLHVMIDPAVADAQHAEREIASGRRRGMLHGVPLALKDLFDTAGVPTTAHSRVAIDRIPQTDATVTARLRQAGAVLLGKLALHEFAHGGPSLDNPWPPARNPWNLAYFTGSSSSGSAVAVAAGLSPASVGTDTGGSIRIPAGMCGVAGLKPTYGLVSRHGVIPCSPSLDHVGPMAWTSADCAILLQAIAGHDANDPSSVDVKVPDYLAHLSGHLRGVRIGVVRHFWERDLSVSPDAAQSIERALDVLRDLGAKLDEVTLRPLQHYSDVRVLLQEPEVFSIHHADLQRRPHDYGRDFLGRVLFACAVGAHVYVHVGRERRRMIEEMHTAFADHDVLVTVGPGPAPRFDAEGTSGFIHGLWTKPNVTSPFSVTGFPAHNVCTGFSRDGLPVSMQIVARPFDDATALRVGDAYERATPWRARRPQLSPDAQAPPIELASERVPTLDARTRAFIECAVEHAGLNLNESQLELMYAAAPHALAMAQRICREYDWAAQPASVFRLEVPCTSSP